MKAAQLDAVAQALVEKHAELSVARIDKIQQRAALMRELRDIDRQLYECRAAARFFGVEDRLPEEEDERMELARREREMRNARVHGYYEEVRAPNGRMIAVHREAPSPPPSQATPSMPASLPAPVPDAPKAPSRPAARPPVREYLLRQLQICGQAGAKAAELRAAFQQEFHIEIHEKTVGMTLYRLSLGHEVHRRGHLWFYGSDPAGHQDSDGEVPNA